MSLYGLLKFVHILSAILAVGFSASYTVWLWRALDRPGQLAYALAGIRFLDRRFTNPAYIFLLLTGLAMILVSGLPLTRFWTAAALVLYVLVVAIGIGAYVPLFRRLALLLETQGDVSTAARPLLRRTFMLNAIAGLIVLTILALMVFKPTL